MVSSADLQRTPPECSVSSFKMAAGASETQENVLEENIPNLEVQKREIGEKLKAPLQKGDTWYVIDCRWLKQWKKFVGFDKWDQFGVGDASNNPGPIDNSNLFSDGVSLREHLIDELDYNLLPEEAWFKLVSWYGITSPEQAIPRKVVEHGMYVKQYKVEVYLTEIKLCKNSDLQTVVTRQFSKGDTIGHIMSEMKKIFNIPEEAETRVWNKYMSNTYELLSNTEQSVQDAGLYQGQVLVVEQKNEDGSWQRQARTSSFSSSTVTSSNEGSNENSSHSYGYGSLSIRNSWGYDNTRSGSSLAGLTGLANLGNTCFMNSALQCLSNSSPLSEYFLAGLYKDELNLNNPLGMHGEIAKAYAGLLHHIWNENYSSVAPRQFKMQVGRFAPQFSGYQQQDSQELLAFLLDGLHEDLNRVKKKPYVEVKDADGRPDKVVAKETWYNHLQRNDSIIVDIFHGLFKSTLVCPDCNKVSITFDPFCYLSLPLPVKKERNINVFLVRKDPLVKPTLFKLTVPKMGNIEDLLTVLSREANICKDKMVVADVYNRRFHKVFSLNESLTQILDRDDIFVYELSHSAFEDNEDSFIVLPVYQREKRMRLASYSSPCKSLFGLPLMVSVPTKNFTYKMLYNIMMSKMRRYVHFPQEDAEMDCEDSRVTEDDVEMNDLKKGVSDDENSESELEKACQNVHVNSDENDQDDGTDDEHEDPSQKIKNRQCKVVNSKKHLFNLMLVNSYGSADIRDLEDNDKPLKLTGGCYLALDWNSSDKEKYYNDQLAEESDEHESVQRKPGQKKNAICLADCIELFLSKEKLGANDPWYCPSCKKHQQATKKFDLWCLPEILVVHLKRFSYNSFWRDKLDTLVNFPLRNLDMSDYVISKDRHSPVYDLIAVSNHYGGMGGGHYTAYAKNCKDGQWYSFDDSCVSTVNEDRIVSKAAYVLFYQRQKPTEREREGESRPDGQDVDMNS